MGLRESLQQMATKWRGRETPWSDRCAANFSRNYCGNCDMPARAASTGRNIRVPRPPRRLFSFVLFVDRALLLA